MLLLLSISFCCAERFTKQNSALLFATATGNTISQCNTPPATFLAILLQFQQGRMRTLPHYFVLRNSGYTITSLSSGQKILQVAEIALYCNIQPRQLARLHFQAMRGKLLRKLRSVTALLTTFRIICHRIQSCMNSFYTEKSFILSSIGLGKEYRYLHAHGLATSIQFLAFI